MHNEQIISVGKFIDHAAELLTDLKTTHTPLILIQNDAPVAVIQGMEEYRRLVDALYLLKLMAQGEKEIQAGQGRMQAEVFADINRMLEAKNE